VTGDATSLALTLRELRPLLASPEVMELCINRPGEAYVETRGGWQRHVIPFATYDWCRRLAKLVANSTRQRIDESSPLLSASLPSGERVQIVLPPATSAGCVAITVRRPAERSWTIDELAQMGIFRRTRQAAAGPDPTDAELRRLLDSQDYQGFMRLAVQGRRNILVSGPTGSGKTTWTKALIREIPPEERLITIEDAS
jgi:type IV secretion system protein VirB11